MNIHSLKKDTQLTNKNDLFRIDGRFFHKNTVFTNISEDIEIESTKRIQDSNGEIIRICDETINKFNLIKKD